MIKPIIYKPTISIMFIKHLAKFAALAMAVSLWSCSDDLPENGPDVEEEKGDFYATVTLQLPTGNGSRSSTIDPTNPPTGTQPGEQPAQSSDGYEVGSDAENTITSVAVVLAGKNDETGVYTKIATGETESPIGNPSTKNQYTLKFRSSELIEYYRTNKSPSKKLYIFVYCNVGADLRSALKRSEYSFNPYTKTNLTLPTAAQIEITEEDESVLQSPVIRNSISQVNNFLMTNANLPTYDDFGEMSAEDIVNKLKEYNKPGNALPLTTSDNPVKVERLACRFDYQMSGPFNVQFEDTVYASISIAGLSLFNESKAFYLFPHMTGTNTTSQNAGTPAVTVTGDAASVDATKFTICGNEFGNYVGSPNWGAMLSPSTTNTQLAALFNYPTALQKLPYNFTYTPVTNINTSDGDIHGSTQTPTWNFTDTDYRIWRYSTENTIPTVNGQINGVSTGIYFRCLITPATEPKVGSVAWKIKQAMDAGVPIYAYSENAADDQNNTADIYTLIGSAQEVFNLARTNTTGVIAISFVKGFKYGLFTVKKADGTAISSTNINLEDIDNTLPDGLWEATNVVTTVSSMRRNTNSTPLPNGNGKKLKDLSLYAYWTLQTTAPYSYYCYYPYYNRHNDNGDNADMGPMEFATVRNNIYKLKVTNITRIGLPSDVPPDPDTPDESEDVYIQVDVKVLDWVVRLNNIVF